MSNVDNKNSNGIPSNNIGLLMDVTINVTVLLILYIIQLQQILRKINNIFPLIP